MKRSEMEITSTDLLASLVEECRKLVDASGLEGGAGGGWDAYDDLLTELRKRLKASESHLANAQIVRCPECGGREVTSNFLLTYDGKFDILPFIKDHKGKV